jgi:Ca-activated chloride channel family protein
MKALLALALLAACEKAKPTPPVPRDASVPDAFVWTSEKVVALDVSRSMMESDLVPDRFEATKAAVLKHLSGHRVIAFGQEVRHIDNLERLELGDLKDMGCAMGDGLAQAVQALIPAKVRFKRVILIVDGDSNVVIEHTVEEATELARANGIEVGVVVVGSLDPTAFGGAAVDVAPLKQIAKATGGTFYRATDAASLAQALDALH